MALILYWLRPRYTECSLSTICSALLSLTFHKFCNIGRGTARCFSRTNNTRSFFASIRPCSQDATVHDYQIPWPRALKLLGYVDNFADTVIAVYRRGHERPLDKSLLQVVAHASRLYSCLVDIFGTEDLAMPNASGNPLHTREMASKSSLFSVASLYSP